MALQTIPNVRDLVLVMMLLFVVVVCCLLLYISSLPFDCFGWGPGFISVLRLSALSFLVDEGED